MSLSSPRLGLLVVGLAGLATALSLAPACSPDAVVGKPTTTGQGGRGAATATASVSSVGGGAIGGAAPVQLDGLWGEVYGDPAAQFSLDASPLDGGLVVVGEFSGVMAGTPLVTTAGDTDAFWFQVLSDGALGWAGSYSSPGYQTVVRVAVGGPDGDIALLAAYKNGLDFGCGEHFNQELSLQIAVALLASDGSCLWSRASSGTGVQTGYGVTIDAAGDVIVSGTFQNSVDFGAELLEITGRTNGFVVKLSGTAGQELWALPLGADVYPYDLAVAPTGNVLVGGGFEVDASLPPVMLQNVGGWDAYLLALDGSTGVPRWAETSGDSADQLVKRVAVDAAGNIFVGGNFDGTIGFGGPALSGKGGSEVGGDVFVIALDSTRQHRWGIAFGDDQDQSLGDMALGPEGALALAASFEGTISVAGGPEIGATFGTEHKADVLLALLDEQGNHLISSGFGGLEMDIPTGVGFDEQSNIVVAGSLRSEVDFGTGVLATHGFFDVFAAKLSTGL